MKRDFLLGGTKLPTGGAVRGAGGGHVPPSLYVKRGPESTANRLMKFQGIFKEITYTI